MVEADALPMRMDDLNRRWEAAGDARCVFLNCYALMTRNTLAALAVGRFTNRAWVNQLVHQFADYYFRALDEYEHATAALPAVWKLTFDLAHSPATTVMEDLLLGINAHINHDLPMAIYDTLMVDWPSLTFAEREARAADHRRINQIISETMQPVHTQVVEHYARLAGAVAKVLGGVFDWEMGRLITAWRKDVWTYALRLLEAPMPEDRERLRRDLDRIALARIHLLLSARGVRNKAFGYPISLLHARGLI